MIWIGYLGTAITAMLPTGIANWSGYIYGRDED